MIKTIAYITGIAILVFLWSISVSPTLPSMVVINGILISTILVSFFGMVPCVSFLCILGILMDWYLNQFFGLFLISIAITMFVSRLILRRSIQSNALKIVVLASAGTIAYHVSMYLLLCISIGIPDMLLYGFFSTDAFVSLLIEYLSTVVVISILIAIVPAIKRAYVSKL